MGLFDKFKKKKNEDYIDYTQEAQNTRFDEQIKNSVSPAPDEATRAREDWEKSSKEFEEKLRRAEEKARVKETEREVRRTEQMGKRAEDARQAKAEYEQAINEAKQATTATATATQQPQSGTSQEQLLKERELAIKSRKLDLEAKQQEEENKLKKEETKSKVAALKTAQMSASTKRFVGIVKGVSTMGGKVRIRPDAKKYYIPTPPRDIYVPTGMRELTKPKMGQSLHTTNLRKAGTPNFQALQRATTPSSRMGTQPRPGFQSSMPNRPSMNITTSPIAKAAFGSVSNKSMLTGGSNQTQAMARLRELMMPRGLNRNEKIAFQGISEAGAGSRSQVVSELTARGMSQTEASMAVDGLVRKGAVSKVQTPSGEQVLEVTR